MIHIFLTPQKINKFRRSHPQGEKQQTTKGYPSDLHGGKIGNFYQREDTRSQIYAVNANQMNRCQQVTTLTGSQKKAASVI